MKLKMLLCIVVLGAVFAGCTTSHYVTGQGSPHRHQGYRKQSDQSTRDPYYYRGGPGERAVRRNYYMRRYNGW